MANHKSAEKRDRQKVKRRVANRVAIGRMRTALKSARAAVDQKAPEADKLIRLAVSFIDKAISKGALKRNTGARYISRLTRRSSRISAAS